MNIAKLNLGLILKLSLFVLTPIAVSSCSPIISRTEPVPTILTTLEPQIEVIPTNTREPNYDTNECIEVFLQRELQANRKKKTLSSSELDQYLVVMGIESLCISPELGAPFINTDWDAADQTADNGRMISLGFENLYSGAGWSEGFILYSTYDFSAGTEYETFAESIDYEAIQQGQIENQIVIDNTSGFIRYTRSSYCFGKCALYKAYVFPYKSHYLAMVYNLGSYDYDSDWETILNSYKEGNYPNQDEAGIAAFDFLVSSIQFFEKEFSIYLPDQDISAVEFSKIDIEEVILEKTPLISSKDIVNYDLDSHSILLTPAGYRRLQQVFQKPVKVSGIPFVVCVGSERIYSGALWTPASSISYDGVVILQSFEDDALTISLTLGYPVPDVFTGSDPRSDPRIVEALEQADKLKSVPE